ncbi:MAG TPA: hypothetical protein PKA62_06175, partial [Thermoanaerobaculia bacterium]|nr:hypothetical protein [Thermoanaerobaculia bacterium]
MAQEIERKFLVAGPFKEQATRQTRIVQGYLSSVPERTVRVRIKGDKGFLTVKEGHFVFAQGDGRPVRFWGTNPALYGPYPEKADAPGIAACLAR